MPSFCLYGMCHNLGSSSYQGYCNQNHMKRAWDLEERAYKAAAESLSTIAASSQTLPKDSLSVTLPSKELSSKRQSKQNEKPQASCNPETLCATVPTNTSENARGHYDSQSK